MSAAGERQRLEPGPRLRADSPRLRSAPHYLAREAEVFVTFVAAFKGFRNLPFAHLFDQALGVVKFHDVASRSRAKSFVCSSHSCRWLSVSCCDGPRRLSSAV